MVPSDKIRLLRLFVACPGDVSAEKDRVAKIADSLQAVARAAGFLLEVKDWRQVLPSMGRPQQVILDQIPAETWDIFIGILWLRFGQPSGGRDAAGNPDESGTYEEFRIAYNLWQKTERPRILIYQCRRPPNDPYNVDEEQFGKVKKFFAGFELSGNHEGLIKPYKDVDEFAELLRGHLQDLLLQTLAPTIKRKKRATKKAVKDIDLELYRAAISGKYRHLKLETLKADQTHYIDVELRSVFIPQDVKNCQQWLPERLVGPKTPPSLKTGDLESMKLADVRHLEDFKKQKSRNVLDVLKDPNGRLITVLGDPGAGKSSLLYVELLEWIAAKDPLRSIPFLIELRHYHREAPDTDFLDYLAKNPGLAFNPAKRALRYRLKRGAAILLFDGLDEVFHPAHRKRVAQRIITLAQEFPSARIIVTSRLVGYPPRILRDAGFDHWVLQDFDDRQRDEFLQRWCNLVVRDDGDRGLVRDRVRSAALIPSVRELSGNPLLLTMMAMLARQSDLPRDQISLYQECSKLLLELWDANKAISRDEALSDIRFDWRDKHDLLCRLAWYMQNAQAGFRGNVVSRSALEKRLEETFSYIPDGARRKRVIELVIDQLRERNFILCHLGGEYYAFVHRGFLEYFCAEEIRRLSASGDRAPADIASEIFREHSAEDAWKEVLILAAAALPPQVADRALSAAIKGASKGDERSVGIATETLRLARNLKALPRTEATVRPLLERQALKITTKTFFPAISSLVALGETWPDDRTAAVMIRIGKKSLGSAGGWAALFYLLKIKPDNSAFALAKRFMLTKSADVWSTPVCRQFLDLFGKRKDVTAVIRRLRATERGARALREARALTRDQALQLSIQFMPTRSKGIETRSNKSRMRNRKKA